MNCGNDLPARRNWSIRKYCNQGCQSEYVFKNVTINRVENNLVRDSATLKNYLTKIRGYRCEGCGLFEWLGKPISLHVDHVNGDSDENRPFNIRLLCPNCHSQTPTFCGRNKKNSRRSRYNLEWRRKKMVGCEGLEPPVIGM